MNERDGLYLEDVQVASPDGIATTYQSNDLTKPTSLQISHSNTFPVPDSLLMRRLTQNAEQLDSASPDPYRTIRASLVRSGITIFTGIAELEHFQAGWDVTLYDEKRNLYDRLERSIRTADLSRYDHPWTLTSINELADSTAGVCYALVDNGLLSGGVLPMDSITPAVYLHTLITQLLSEEGYRLVGNLPSDPIYQRAVLPFVEAEPTSNDEQWQEDRKARVTRQAADESVTRDVLGNGHVIDRIQPFNLEAEESPQGRLRLYNTSTFTYVCDTAMRVRVQAAQMYRVSNITGSVEVILSVEKNGQNVAQEYFSTPGGYNILNLRDDTIELDELVSCKKGDRLQVRLIIRRKTKVGNFKITVYNNPDSCFASFTPSLSTEFGDRWAVARNLPDISALTLLKSVAFMMCGVFVVDSFRKEIYLSRFTDTANSKNYVDWSNRIDTGEEPSWSPRLEPYAQKNYLVWQEVEEIKKLQGKVGGQTTRTLYYGDGVIGINNATLDADTTLIEMPFGASINSEQVIPGYGNPVLIKTRSVSGSGDNKTINREPTTPRLILVAPELTVPVNSLVLSDDGLTQTPAIVSLKPAWFGPRPPMIVRKETAFCLLFSPAVGLTGEQCLIDRYYEGLKGVLRRVRVLEVSMVLSETDIASLDFERPIRLQRVKIGSLSVSDGLWYLNKISDYQPGLPCRVTLIALL